MKEIDYSNSITNLCAGKLLLREVVRKLKVVILPTRVVQYCKQPFGGLKLKNYIAAKISQLLRLINRSKWSA